MEIPSLAGWVEIAKNPRSFFNSRSLFLSLASFALQIGVILHGSSDSLALSKGSVPFFVTYGITSISLSSLWLSALEDETFIFALQAKMKAMAYGLILTGLIFFGYDFYRGYFCQKCIFSVLSSFTLFLLYLFSAAQIAFYAAPVVIFCSLLFRTGTTR